jgi:hypothetical protein
VITEQLYEVLNRTEVGWMQPVWINPVSPTLEKRMVRLDPFCRLIGSNVSANFVNPFNGSVLIRKDEWVTEISLTDAKSVEVPVPRRAFMFSGNIYLDFSDSNRQWVDGCKVPVSQIVLCEFSDCILCVD